MKAFMFFSSSVELIWILDKLYKVFRLKDLVHTLVSNIYMAALL